MTAKAEKTPKVQNPQAFDPSALPRVPANCEWEIVEIGKIDFALAHASDMAGIETLTKGNESKAAQLFNRALRIDAPAKLDARERIDTARKNGTLPEVMEKLQNELYSFDVTSIATRAPRQVKPIVAEDKETYSKAEFEAMVAAAGHKVVFTK